MITRRHTAMVRRINNAEMKLLKVSEQLQILTLKLDELRRRRESASRGNQRHFVYSITLRMAVIDGVINVLHEYIRNIADEIRNLRWLTYQQLVIIVAAGNDDSDSEDDQMEIEV